MSTYRIHDTKYVPCEVSRLAPLILVQWADALNPHAIPYHGKQRIKAPKRGFCRTILRYSCVVCCTLVITTCRDSENPASMPAFSFVSVLSAFFCIQVSCIYSKRTNVGLPIRATRGYGQDIRAFVRARYFTTRLLGLDNTHRR